MKTYAVLREIHRRYQPRSYLEIGIRIGRSLALSRTRTIAVDPGFKIKSELQCDLQLVRATSDEFFARRDALAHFPNERIDLAFVDGLHLFEFALRDFMNVERHTHWASVIVIDDALPRNVEEASRDRGGLAAWAGDVFKLTEVLARYRPDLLLLPLNAEPTGVLLVLGADSENSVLEEHYDEIVAKYVQADPQSVPETVLRRKTALDAASIALSELWGHLRDARDSGLARELGWERVCRSVEAAAQPAGRREPTHEPSHPPTRATRRTKGGRALAALRRHLRPLPRRR